MIEGPPQTEIDSWLDGPCRKHQNDMLARHKRITCDHARLISRQIQRDRPGSESLKKPRAYSSMAVDLLRRYDYAPRRLAGIFVGLVGMPRSLQTTTRRCNSWLPNPPGNIDPFERSVESRRSCQRWGRETWITEPVSCNRYWAGRTELSIAPGCTASSRNARKVEYNSRLSQASDGMRWGCHEGLRESYHWLPPEFNARDTLLRKTRTLPGLRIIDPNSHLTRSPRIEP